MKYTTNCALGIKGTRVERGQTIELTEEEAERFGADLTPGEGADEAPAEEETEEVPLDEMTSAQLKERAKELGLSTSGSKADLLERIELQGNSADETPAEEETEEDN